MKTVLAVIVGFVVLLVSWIVTVVLISLIDGVVAVARPGLGPDHWLNLLLGWVLGPGVGAFFAIYVPSIMFRSVEPHTLFISFISINVFIYLLVLITGLYVLNVEGSGIGQIIIHVIQGAALILGAYIGRAVAIGQRKINCLIQTLDQQL